MNGLDNDGVNDIRKLLLKLKDEGKTILPAIIKKISKLYAIKYI